jgi:hypothetical protein
MEGVHKAPSIFLLFLRTIQDILKNEMFIVIYPNLLLLKHNESRDSSYIKKNYDQNN